MKEVWSQCWDEFVVWFAEQWKYSWGLLSTSIIGLIQSCFEWLKTIVGGAFAGFWKLVVKPIGKWSYEKIVEWIKNI